MGAFVRLFIFQNDPSDSDIDPDDGTLDFSTAYKTACEPPTLSFCPFRLDTRTTNRWQTPPCAGRVKGKHNSSAGRETFYGWNNGLAHAATHTHSHRTGWCKHRQLLISRGGSCHSYFNTTVFPSTPVTFMCSQFSLTHPSLKRGPPELQIHEGTLQTSQCSCHSSPVAIIERNEQSFPFGHIITSHPSNKCSCFRSEHGETVRMQVWMVAPWPTELCKIRPLLCARQKIK